MTFSAIELSRRGSIALLGLNRPDKLNRLLLGLRGRPAANRQALINSMFNLSRLNYVLQDSIDEIDINPIIANASNAVAVDAMIALKPQQHRC